MNFKTIFSLLLLGISFCHPNELCDSVIVERKMVAGPALPNGFDCMCACSRGTDMYAVHWSTKILSYGAGNTSWVDVPGSNYTASQIMSQSKHFDRRTDLGPGLSSHQCAFVEDLLYLFDSWQFHIFNTTANQWLPKTILLVQGVYSNNRLIAPAIEVYAHKIYLFGGEAQSIMVYAYEFDTILETWTRLPNVPFQGAGACVTRAGTSFHYMGGNNDPPGTIITGKPKHSAYNILTKSWMPKANLPSTCGSHSCTVGCAAVYRAGQIFFFPGWTRQSDKPPHHPAIYGKSVFLYNVAHDIWMNGGTGVASMLDYGGTTFAGNLDGQVTVTCRQRYHEYETGTDVLTTNSTAYPCTLYVDPHVGYNTTHGGCGLQQYPCRTLSEALAHARDGATIILADGELSGNGNSELQVTVANISIISASFDPKVSYIRGSASSSRPCLSINVNSNFSSILIKGVGFYGCSSLITDGVSVSVTYDTNLTGVVRVENCIFDSSTLRVPGSISGVGVQNLIWIGHSSATLYQDTRVFFINTTLSNHSGEEGRLIFVAGTLSLVDCHVINNHVEIAKASSLVVVSTKFTGNVNGTFDIHLVSDSSFLHPEAAIFTHVMWESCSFLHLPAISVTTAGNHQALTTLRMERCTFLRCVGKLVSTEIGLQASDLSLNACEVPSSLSLIEISSCTGECNPSMHLSNVSLVGNILNTDSCIFRVALGESTAGTAVADISIDTGSFYHNVGKGILFDFTGTNTSLAIENIHVYNNLLRSGTVFKMTKGKAVFQNCNSTGNQLIGFGGLVAFGSNSTAQQQVTCSGYVPFSYGIDNATAQGVGAAASLLECISHNNTLAVIGSETIDLSSTCLQTHRPIRVAIQAYDFCNQQIRSGGSPWLFKVSALEISEFERAIPQNTPQDSPLLPIDAESNTARISSFSVLDNSDGTYTALLYITEAGNYSIEAETSYGMQLLGSPLFANVRHASLGHASPDKSYGYGEGISSIPWYCPHSNTSFVVQTVDNFFNNMSSCQDATVTATITDNRNDHLPSSISCMPELCGAFEVEYMLSSSPWYNVTVYIDGLPMKGIAPLATVPVVAVNISMDKSYFQIRESSEGIAAGQAAVIYLELKDESGQQWPDCRAEACITARFLCVNESLMVPAPLRSCKNGVLTFTAHLNRTGVYEASVLYHGVPFLPSSLHDDQLTVSAGNAFGAVSLMGGSFIASPTISVAKSNEYTLYCDMYDQFNNSVPCQQGNEPSMSITDPDSVTVPQILQCPESNSGRYVVQGGVSAPAPGVYTVTAILNNSLLSNSPVSVFAFRAGCPFGKFNTLDGCQDCPQGQYNSNPWATSCNTCPANSTTVTTGASTPDDCGCRSGFYDESDHINGGLVCSTCPTDSDSAFNSTTIEDCDCDAGYYGNIGNANEQCFSCTLRGPSVCLGGETCGTGYTGFVCLECDDNYFAFLGGPCVECIEYGSLISTVLLLVVAFLVWLFLQAEKGLALNTVHLVAGHFKMLAVFARLQVPWTIVIATIFALCSLLNINLDFFFPSCHSIPSYVFWVITLLIPVMLIICLVSFALVWVLVLRFRIWPLTGKDDNLPIALVNAESMQVEQEDDIDMEVTSNSLHNVLSSSDSGDPPLQTDSLSVLSESSFSAIDDDKFDRSNWRLFLLPQLAAFSFDFLSFAYVFLTEAALEPFGCSQREDGLWVISTDPGQACFDSLWFSFYLPIAIVSTLVYTVGIPIAMAYVFWVSRTNTSPPYITTSVQRLSDSYKPKFFYWELVIKGEEFVLTACLTIIPQPAIQLASVSAVLLAISLLQVGFNPFKRPIYNWMNFSFILLKYFVIMSGGMLLADPQSSSVGIASIVLVGIAVGVPACFLLATIFVTVMRVAKGRD